MNGVQTFLDVRPAACQTPPMSIGAQHPTTIAQAAKILRAGDVCAFATETVYGLGADATNADAVLKIYQAKRRPRFNPLIAHCADLEMARELVVFNALAEKLAQAFWPGPMTLVLPLKPNNTIADLVTAGLDTLAIRIPADEQARALIKAVGKPLAAPSANPSGSLSATSADQVRRGFNGQVPVLDGGACTAGVESTILAFDDAGGVIQLRAGALPREQVEQLLGQDVPLAAANAAISAPGMLKSHYAPNAKLRLNVSEPRKDEAYLAFGPTSATNPTMRNLSVTGDLVEAARNLFAHLHALDDTSPGCIAVAPIPTTGLGEAINDRLERAAAPRG